MALDFPNSPTVNQVFSAAGASWRWDGTKWEAQNASTLVVPVTIPEGGTGATTAPAALTNLGAAPLASPAFTGTPSLPTGTTGVTQTAGTSNTSLATTAFVGSAVTAAPYVPLAGGVTVTGALTLSASGTPLNLSNGYLNVAGGITVGQTATFNNGTINCLRSGSYGGISYASGYHYMGFNWNSTNGNIDFYVDYNWTGSINVNISDPRLKTNRASVAIDPLGVVNSIALEQFDLTPPVEGATARHWPIGVMSDQLADVLPQAVSRPEIAGQETHDSVDTLMLVSCLIGAVQQLTRRVAEHDPR